MDLSKGGSSEDRGPAACCVLADSHTHPAARHKSQLWREILSMNGELRSALQPPPTPCRTGREIP